VKLCLNSKSFVIFLNFLLNTFLVNRLGQKNCLRLNN
jgi:hypothetical protein